MTTKEKIKEYVDDHFNCFGFFPCDVEVDGKVESIVNTSVDYQDSELLEDFEDLFEVHDILEDIKVQHEKKLQAARAKQPKAEW